MIIIATLENIEKGIFTITKVEAKDYASGFSRLRNAVPEGQRIVNVRVQRS